jgi:hypothetical protein
MPFGLPWSPIVKPRVPACSCTRTNSSGFSRSRARTSAREPIRALPAEAVSKVDRLMPPSSRHTWLTERVERRARRAAGTNVSDKTVICLNAQPVSREAQLTQGPLTRGPEAGETVEDAGTLLPQHIPRDLLNPFNAFKQAGETGERFGTRSAYTCRYTLSNSSYCTCLFSIHGPRIGFPTFPSLI